MSTYTHCCPSQEPHGEHLVLVQQGVEAHHAREARHEHLVGVGPTSESGLPLALMML